MKILYMIQDNQGFNNQIVNVDFGDYVPMLGDVIDFDDDDTFYYVAKRQWVASASTLTIIVKARN